MPQADFYHLQKQTLENVLPKLLEKAYATGKRIKVKIGNEERVEFINGILWTYDDQSFIPHGSKKDGFAEDQPVWLTAGDDNPNNAEFLFLVDGALVTAVEQARAFWKELKAAGFTINYWQQNDAGRWQQKA